MISEGCTRGVQAGSVIKEASTRSYNTIFQNRSPRSINCQVFKGSRLGFVRGFRSGSRGCVSIRARMCYLLWPFKGRLCTHCLTGGFEGANRLLMAKRFKYLSIGLRVHMAGL